MTKSGKLSAADLFYVKRNPDNKTIHELAAELDRSPQTIAKYYELEKETVNTAAPATTTATERPESPMFQLMGRHKRNDKNVATVMTKAASELADATRPNRLKEKNKLAGAIHKPKG